ncbi:FadR family transcriptional regulator [Halioglobus maricola]|uniref:FadR family transcriptional regulator n=1 Tax=Halioglobus maricola TaxID=2601894 RepID=A0A5P9NIY6_9GAMM|nr:FadR/GntR family transcriptional regulator [Halioglobus maricola]QFU75184.1 FadR family transcriptional regulator [Halioglobus maricola]
MTTSRLYSQVVEQVSQLIESGEYAIGSRLPPERELAERFSVSRPTVREAIIALEAVGKIAVRSGSGMYVASSAAITGPGANISPFELMESRVLIEGEAAALAASLISSDQLERLAEELEVMAQENAVEGLGRDCADRRFHLIIARATKNQMLEGLIEKLWDTQQGLAHIRTAHQSVCKPDPEIRLNEHRAIYDALAAHDSQAARAAMRQHFARSIEALHAATEEEAVAEVRRRLSQTRERFSSDRIIDSGAHR